VAVRHPPGGRCWCQAGAALGISWNAPGTPSGNQGLTLDPAQAAGRPASAQHELAMLLPDIVPDADPSEVAAEEAARLTDTTKTGTSVDVGAEPGRTFGDALRHILTHWHPLDPPHRRWTSDQGLLVLIELIRRHLFLELRWRQTGTWVLEDAPHG
jgi:hypothetical protein